MLYKYNYALYTPFETGISYSALTPERVIYLLHVSTSFLFIAELYMMYVHIHSLFNLLKNIWEY